MGKSEIDRVLATVIHELWSGWMLHLFGRCRDADGDWLIPSDEVSRWVRRVNTPYSELDADEQESGLVQAQKVREALVEAGFSIVSTKWVEDHASN